jgi:DNA-binding NarL/FixJ family response regulator
MNIRVIVADDHSLVRLGIRRFLTRYPDIEVIGEAENGKQALQLVEKLKPDVLLLDIELPDIKGFEVARELELQGSSTRILAVSAYSDKQYILGMILNGAAGYMVKEDVPDTIYQAIRSIAKGERGWLSPKASKIINV